MAYRAVPLTDRQCAHCGQTYQAKDRRRIYCSSSCNTLAWMARRGSRPAKPVVATDSATEQGQDITFSLGSITTIGMGVLAADAVKATAQAVFSNEPSLNARIDHLERLIEGLHRKQDALERAAQHTGAMLTDVMQGVGATGKPAEQAIIASQQRRGLLPPTEPVSTNGR